MTKNATRTAADAAKMQEREELALDFISFQLENDVFFRVCEASGDEITPAKMRTMYLSDLWTGKRPYKPYLLPTLDTIETLLNMTEGKPDAQPVEL